MTTINSLYQPSSGLWSSTERSEFYLKIVDFHGWEGAALWDDIKFDLKHFSDIERLAMVGDRGWEKGMSLFCRPFTTAKICYFDESKADEGWN